MKGIPLAYNKDMQEDKEPVFDAVDTVIMCLKVFTPMIASMKVHDEKMMKAAQNGFINATDLADYMVKKGLPFRSAYKISGQIVADCIASGQILETLPLAEYKKYWDQFEEDLYDDIDLRNAADRRTSKGGASRASIKEQIELIRKTTE
jgi:argininosuccinate lyase